MRYGNSKDLEKYTDLLDISIGAPRDFVRERGLPFTKDSDAFILSQSRGSDHNNIWSDISKSLVETTRNQRYDLVLLEVLLRKTSYYKLDYKRQKQSHFKL